MISLPHPTLCDWSNLPFYLNLSTNHMGWQPFWVYQTLLVQGLQVVDPAI
jgi:hypothetical protein